jgi:hypothetical protein
MSADALLYPGKADDEALRNMPPTIIWEDDFDIFTKEATRKETQIQ